MCGAAGEIAAPAVITLRGSPIRPCLPLDQVEFSTAAAVLFFACAFPHSAIIAFSLEAGNKYFGRAFGSQVNAI